MKRVRALWLAGLLMLLLTAGARGTTCLILPFENETRNASLEWIGESFVESLAERLVGPRLLVVSREERGAAFDMLGIPAVIVLSRATVIKVAETLDADYVIIGQYKLADEKRLQVSAQLLEMRPPQIRLKVDESGLLAELLEVQERVAEAVARQLPEAPAASPSRHRLRLDAWENYVRGLTASTRALQLKQLREAVRLEPALGRASLELGKLYAEDHDYATAVLWLSKLKSDEPNYLEARFLLGICHFFLEDYERAEAAFQAVAQQLPLSEIYSNLGAAQSRRNRRSAVENLRKAAEGDPADPDYQFNLGYWYWKNGQYAAAARRLRLALERRPNDGEARALLARSLERSGNPAEAARERELLARNPAATRFTDLSDDIFADLERIKRHYPEASFRHLQLTLETLTEESLSRLPAAEHARVHLERGRELFREQSDAEALNQLEEAARLDASLAEAHLLLARLHERGGRKEQAIREAEAALGLEKSADAHLLLAKIYLEQNKLAAAREQALGALRVDPNNVAARSVLKTVEMRSP